MKSNESLEAVENIIFSKIQNLFFEHKSKSQPTCAIKDLPLTLDNLIKKFRNQ